MYSVNTTNYSHPTAGFVQGSNDGDNWEQIATFTGWAKRKGALLPINWSFPLYSLSLFFFFTIPYIAISFPLYIVYHSFQIVSTV